jgi:hypothetical protein
MVLTTGREQLVVHDALVTKRFGKQIVVRQNNVQAPASLTGAEQTLLLSLTYHEYGCKAASEERCIP